MTEINGKIEKVHILDEYSFYVDIDTRDFNNYLRYGIATEVKYPINVHFSNL